jgi:hypothetical protein
MNYHHRMTFQQTEPQISKVRDSTCAPSAFTIPD